MMIQKLKYLFLFLVLWLVGHLTYMIGDGVQQPKEKADVAVILGNKVNENGTLSLRLSKRMQCGLDLFRKGIVDRIIVSGGLGKEGFYEAEKMKTYLMENGVPAHLILVDNFGDNTEATVGNVLEIKRQFPFESLIVVSQYHHITRTKMLFRKKGFYRVQGASPAFFEWRDFYACIREFIAYYWNRFT